MDGRGSASTAATAARALVGASPAVALLPRDPCRIGFAQVLKIGAHVVEALIRHALKHVTEVITHAHSATYGVIILPMFFLTTPSATRS
jgi:hypothetical protein